jgi:hypothetical protein
MPSYKVSHIKVQGVDLVIVFVPNSFPVEGNRAQNEAIVELERRTKALGWAGSVVPVWKNENGTTGFIAKESYHAFFKSVSYDSLAKNINKELAW